MSGKEIDLQKIKELVKLVEKHGLAELAIEEDGISIVVKGTATPAGAPTVSTHPATGKPTPEAEAHGAEVEAAEEAGNIVTIEAPMVGVFYRAASPDSPPFVDVGDEVEAGQTVGVIEAMKVFSEIPTEVAGIVVEIPGANGKLAHQGDPLVRIRTEERV